MARLLVELLNSDKLAELAIGGAWSALRSILLGRPALCSLFLELNICGLALTHLQRIGSAAEWTVSGTLMWWFRCVPSDQSCGWMYGVFIERLAR